MKICIVSDLHCKYQLDISESSDTLLFSNMPRKPATQHPVVSMINQIEKDRNIESDILLCLGDLGDKADEQGIASAWTFIDEIKLKLKAKIRIGVPGNHDINSRHKNNKDAFTYIKNFHEHFPTDNENLNTKFWELGYCIYEFKNCMLLLVNTIHNHEDEEKAKSSLLDKTVLENISDELILKKDFKYKICLLHHHPIKHSNIHNYRDSDSIERGDELISLLVKQDFQIVIHGHKHQPRIVEYNGLPIFATGSFSSFANLQGTGLSTMFHIVELKESRKEGIIHSWEYNIKSGWNKNYNINFPPKIGFGASIDLKKAAGDIYNLWNKNKIKKPLIYSAVLIKMPQLDFLIPDSLTKLGEILKDDYSLGASPQFPLTPYIITKLL